MTKFKVGDKVRVIGDDEFIPKGTVLTVESGPVGSTYGGNYKFKERSGIVLGCNLEKVSDKPTKNQRIATLEQQVADLQAEVEALKKAQNPKYTLDELLPKTPNQKRKAIIDEAKAFVAEVTANMNDDDFDAKEGNGTYRSRNTKPEFIVNNGKRTVVVLVKGAYNPVLYEKGIAKCAPDDVFNADIGKAIALGRALGLDVTRFEQAVQPTEFAVGQTIEARFGDDTFVEKVVKIDGGKAGVKSGGFYWMHRIRQDNYRVLDDTEAQYV